MRRGHRGWCPPGRISEDGTIPEIFPLKETPEERSQDALDIPRSQRTEWNVRDSDATLVLWPGAFDKRDLGTRYTVDCALRYKKPLLNCDPTEPNDIDKASEWIIRNNIETLNVSGPSERASPGVGASAERFIRKLLNCKQIPPITSSGLLAGVLASPENTVEPLPWWVDPLKKTVGRVGIHRFLYTLLLMALVVIISVVFLVHFLHISVVGGRLYSGGGSRAGYPRDCRRIFSGHRPSGDRWTM